MYKIDLHTHSTASPDGGIDLEQYRQALASGQLDCIAITDHNSIHFATSAHDALGEQIIIGEEIMTTQGEIVGLYLSELVPAGLSPQETIQHIKGQGGMVYVPHPFETVRHGLHPETLDEIADSVDMVEVCNGRAFFQDRSQQAVVWAHLNKVIGVASSDAHGVKGLGKTYTQVNEVATKGNLLELLSKSTRHTEKPSLKALLYPKYHRIRKKLGGKGV